MKTGNLVTFTRGNLIGRVARITKDQTTTSYHYELEMVDDRSLWYSMGHDMVQLPENITQDQIKALAHILR